jgi:hypothetical protein
MAIRYVLYIGDKEGCTKHSYVLYIGDKEGCTKRAL